MAAYDLVNTRWHRRPVSAVIRSLALPRLMVTVDVASFFSGGKSDSLDAIVLRDGRRIGHVGVGVSKGSIDISVYYAHELILSLDFRTKRRRKIDGKIVWLANRRPKFRKFATYARKLLLERDNAPTVAAVMLS